MLRDNSLGWLNLNILCVDEFQPFSIHYTSGDNVFDSIFDGHVNFGQIFGGSEDKETGGGVWHSGHKNIKYVLTGVLLNLTTRGASDKTYSEHSSARKLK